jgi:hypothetical protein
VRGTAALLCLALVVAACGGEEGPSPEAYRAQANDICAQAQQRTAPLAERLARQARGLTAVAAPAAGSTARRLEQAAREQLARLGALERPGDDTEEIEAFLDPAGQLVDVLGRAAQALERREMIAAVGLVQDGQRLAREAGDAAGRYGLTRCREFVALVPS